MLRVSLSTLLFACAIGCTQSLNGSPARPPRSTSQDQNRDNATNVAKIVRDVVAERFKIKPQDIDMTKPLSDPPLKADELDLVQIVITLEERFQVEFPDNIVEKHGGAKLGDRACKLSPLLLVRIAEESKAQASQKK
jgi:acyl carrier protein